MAYHLTARIVLRRNLAQLDQVAQGAWPAPTGAATCIYPVAHSQGFSALKRASATEQGKVSEWVSIAQTGAEQCAGLPCRTVTATTAAARLNVVRRLEKLESQHHQLRARHEEMNTATESSNSPGSKDVFKAHPCA